MSQKAAFHLTAGVCFVIAIVLYVFGFAAPDNGGTVFFLFMGSFFEFMAWRRFTQSQRTQKAE